MLTFLDYCNPDFALSPTGIFSFGWCWWEGMKCFAWLFISWLFQPLWFSSFQFRSGSPRNKSYVWVFSSLVWVFSSLEYVILLTLPRNFAKSSLWSLMSASNWSMKFSKESKLLNFMPGVCRGGRGDSCEYRKCFYNTQLHCIWW